jgi:hypothetical protein
MGAQVLKIVSNSKENTTGSTIAARNLKIYFF